VIGRKAQLAGVFISEGGFRREADTRQERT
jgi:hypothetical protein